MSTSEARAETFDYLEGLLEGFVAYDRDWRMTYMNAAAERLLNRRRGDVLGKTWHEAFPHAVGNAVDHMYQRVMRTRQPERMELFYEHYGRWFEIGAGPLQSGGVAVYFRDTTDNETLNRLGRTLVAEHDLQRVVQAVTDAATQLSGAQFGAFFYNVVNDAGESYMLYTLSGVEREAFSRFPMPRNTAVFAPTFSGTGIVRSDDITQDPRYGRNAPHYGQPKGHLPVRSYLAVPVTSRSGEVLGGLFLGHERTGVFTERAERLVAGVAAQAAVAIDNARLYGALRASEQHLHRLMELMPAAVYTCDADGRISFFNRRAAELWGREPRLHDDDQKFCGSFRLYRPDGSALPHADTPMAMAVREGHPTRGAEVTIERPDGSRIVASVSIEPLHDAQGRRSGAINVFQDITERKRSEEALREADRRKDEFLAMLGHELRNPLAPIAHGLELLQRRPGEPPPGETLAMMQRQLKHLVRLVGDLLEVARITRGRIELQRAPLDLVAAVRNAVQASRPVLDAFGHALQVDLPAEPLMLEADGVRLAQVVSNLLDNAAKYTPPGGRVWLDLRREGGEALLSVRDNGAGIPASLLPELFDMFGRRERTQNTAPGGLGIGLGLARKLVELHGGTLHARSEGPGKGAEFLVRLPLGRDAAPAPAPQTASRAPVARRRRVLVVDDNVDAARMLGMLLEQMGHDVQVAYDGLAALEAARMNRPEVVLLDISMPGIDGLDVAQRLRQDPAFQSVPIVAITGLGQARDRERTREAGFDEHLVKPVAPEALRSVLERL